MNPTGQHHVFGMILMASAVTLNATKDGLAKMIVGELSPLLILWAQFAGFVAQSFGASNSQGIVRHLRRRLVLLVGTLYPAGRGDGHGVGRPPGGDGVILVYVG